MPSFDRHLIQPGQKINLRKTETDGKAFAKDRERCEKELVEFRERIVSLGEKLYAEGRQKLLEAISKPLQA